MDFQCLGLELGSPCTFASFGILETGRAIPGVPASNFLNPSHLLPPTLPTPALKFCFYKGEREKVAVKAQKAETAHCFRVSHNNSPWKLLKYESYFILKF